MSSKLANRLLAPLSLAIIEHAHLRAYNLLHAANARGIRIPLTGAALVGKSFHKTFLEETKTPFPDEQELPATPMLNWKAAEDRTLVKQSALNYREAISTDKYARAYQNKLKGHVAVSRGRAWWRLETMRQIRASNPGIFKGKVIEVGAGTGLTSSTLSKFPEIEEMHCLDYDEYTVENLMPLVQHSLNADTSKITRIAGSYNNLEVADAHYDAVVAVGAMHHSENLDATLAECFRVLKPGGHFLISDYALTGNLSQEEYSMLMNKPISDQEAKKYQESGSLENVRTNLSISEHARPLFLYQAAAFKAGFTVETYVFDASASSGGHGQRISRFRATQRQVPDFYSQSSPEREHGYDRSGNVRSFSMQNAIYYPFYANHTPNLLSLSLLGDRSAKPVYDNVVFILRKPEGTDRDFDFRYKSDDVYKLKSQLQATS
jgi:ubiquinone/menaquinone biosynthesis C-methylase UbiE